MRSLKTPHCFCLWAREKGTASCTHFVLFGIEHTTQMFSRLRCVEREELFIVYELPIHLALLVDDYEVRYVGVSN